MPVTSSRLPTISAPSGGLVRLVAIAAGLIGILLCGLTPLLPVKTHTAAIEWPQGQQLATGTASVTAPLTQQTAQAIDATIPCATINTLPAKGGLVFATVPTVSFSVMQKGMVVSATDQAISISSRGQTLGSLPRTQLNACKELHLWSGPAGVGAQFVGAGPVTTAGPDARPQVDGAFTDLTTTAVKAAGAIGLRVHIEIDSRFDSSPSVIKLAAMVLGVLAVIISLAALVVLDRIGGYHRRIGQRNWKRLLSPRPADLAVTGVLLLWHFLGAGTPDDGYILNMGRGSEHAGYLLNYYRYFGISEAPFDWYYSFLSMWSHVSTSGLWMRLPSLAAGLLSWFILSRILLPRLGRGLRVRTAKASAGGSANMWAIWAGAGVFMAFWLPFDSGLRSESIIVLGSLLTWWGVEQAIATRRLVPAALATFSAGLTLALAPHGVIALAVLIVGARPMLRVITERRRDGDAKPWLGLGSLVAPIVAAAAVVSVIVFRDQTLATVVESMRVRWSVGTTTSWYQEFVRYYFLTVPNSEGSVTRRVPVLLLLGALLATLAVMLRRSKIRDIQGGPVWRLLGAVLVTMLLLQFTPTKWTIQFGIFAGLAAAVAAAATVAVAETAKTSTRNLTVFVSGLLFALAAAAAGYNAWPWGRELGIAWYDKAPQVSGVPVSTGLLIIAVLVGALAVWQHLRLDYAKNKGLAHDSGLDAAAAPSKADARRIFLASSPIALIAILLVVAELAIFAKAAVSRNDSYTVLAGNVQALKGNSCAMSDKVLVEPDSNAGQLAAADGADASTTLQGKDPVGFTPGGVADDLTPEADSAKPGQMHIASGPTQQFAVNGAPAGTLGGRGPKGINGSTVALPFGLDPERTPVLGSYGYNTGDAHLKTDWYQLPADRTSAKLIVITAAGTILSVDDQNYLKYGQSLLVEFGRKDAAGQFVPVGGQIRPIDPGDTDRPNRPWRNLRIPMDRVPGDATVMRLLADDANLDINQWLAVTPPRVPQLRTLQELVGTAPTLIDFMVGDQFPCQRPVTSTHGVNQLPQWRILPNRVRAVSQSRTWMATVDGGLLSTYEALTYARTTSSYLDGDWNQDWGELEMLRPVAPEAPAARVITSERTTSGVSRNGGIWLVPEDE